MSASLTQDAEVGAFLTTRAAADRGAYLRWFKAQGIDKNDAAAVAAADALWRTQPLLQSPGVLTLSQSALVAARGRRVTASEPFPGSIWLRGKSDTDDGRDWTGNLGQFVNMLRHRATLVAPKGAGWVYEPTTNPSGRRTNAATLSVHALFLDCDGTGEWHKLLAALAALDYAYVAYQSGGWSPSMPKWRVVFPLHAPFPTTDESLIHRWKGIYNHARIAFGAVGELLSVGFDPATETPVNPWFLTEKRAPDDPERQIIARLDGYALDLAALALALPDIPEEEEYVTQSSVEKLTLSEERLNEIIDALIPATNHVPVGRRDLYLSLPGALLIRGVPPDDVFAIIEAVSAAYPRHHAEKHADNLHNARTTISKWESGGRYTTIGTLNSVAPEVAAAVDRVLPNLATKGIADNVAAQLYDRGGPTPTVASTVSLPSVNTPLAVVHRTLPLNNFAKAASKLAAKLKTSKLDEMRLSGLLIECFIKGAALPTLETMSVDEMVLRAMRALGRGLPLSSTWAEALDFSLRSLGTTDFTQSTERVASAERAFYEGRGKRGRANQKKATEAANFKAKIESAKKERAEIDQKRASR